MPSSARQRAGAADLKRGDDFFGPAAGLVADLVRSPDAITRKGSRDRAGSADGRR